DPARPARDTWREIVPEREVPLTAFTVAARHLALHYLVDATSRLELCRLDGSPAGAVPLPAVGSVTGFDGDPHGDTLTFGFTSFALAPTAYRYRPGAET